MKIYCGKRATSGDDFTETTEKEIEKKTEKSQAEFIYEINRIENIKREKKRILAHIVCVYIVVHVNMNVGMVGM